MASGFGYNAFVGWVQETTWGTAVTPPTKFGEIVSETIKAMYRREPRPVIRSLDAREGQFYDVLQAAEGAFVIEANYQGMLRLLEHTFGDGSPATVQDEVAVRWTHTFTAKDKVMAGKGLTVYVNTDVEPGGTPTKRVAGFKINSLKMVCDPTKNTTIEVAGGGKLSSDVAVPTPTFPGITTYVAGHQTTLEIDDVVRPMDSAEVMFDNGLDLEKRVLGSKNPDEPVRSQLRSVTGTVTLDAAAADMAKFRAGTFFKIEIIAAGPTLGAGSYGMTLTMPKCLLLEDPYTVQNFGIVKAALAFRATLPVSGELATWTVTNNEATVA
jgi:hypothetical protein